MEPESSLPYSQAPATLPDCFVSRRSISLMSISEHFVFHGEELLAPRPTPKLEGHPLSAVRDCFFSIFVVTLHIGGRSSIRNLRKRHAVVTGTHKNGILCLLHVKSRQTRERKREREYVFLQHVSYQVLF